MKMQSIKLSLFGIVTAALVTMPAIGFAQDKPTTPPAPAAPAKPKAVRPQPFHGKVAAVDAAAMTITVGSTVIGVTSETKISKNEKPATFSDFAIGETVGGSGKKDESGKLNATTIKIGDALKTPKAPKKPKKADKVEETPAPPAAPTK